MGARVSDFKRLAHLHSTRLALWTDAEKTPLQLEFKILVILIAKMGSIADIILFSWLMISFIVQLTTGEPARSEFRSSRSRSIHTRYRNANQMAWHSSKF